MYAEGWEKARLGTRVSRYGREKWIKNFCVKLAKKNFKYKECGCWKYFLCCVPPFRWIYWMGSFYDEFHLTVRVWVLLQFYKCTELPIADSSIVFACVRARANAWTDEQAIGYTALYNLNSWASAVSILFIFHNKLTRALVEYVWKHSPKRQNARIKEWLCRRTSPFI